MNPSQLSTGHLHLQMCDILAENMSCTLGQQDKPLYNTSSDCCTGRGGSGYTMGVPAQEAALILCHLLLLFQTGNTTMTQH